MILAKELRFEASVPVPDSAIEQSKLLAQIAEHKTAFEQAVGTILGDESFVLKDKVVALGRGGPRGPRKAKLEAVQDAAA